MDEQSPVGVLLDVQALQGEDPERGIPRWLADFSRSLRHQGHYCVGLTNPLLRDIHSQFKDCFDALIQNRRSSIRRAITGRRVVYVVGSPFEPVRPIRSLIPDHILDSQIPIATLMYDLALYRFPEYYQIRAGDHQTYAARKTAFQRSDHFLCISQSTANDVKQLWDVPPERISVVGSGISDYFRPPDEPEESTIGPFVMTVGRGDPRKQTSFLIEMFGGLPSVVFSDFKLVVVCRLDSRIEAAWRHLAMQVGLGEDQLVLTGVVEDSKLRHLYRTCEVFVEPSLFEGFGMPLAEAVACGAVAISSNSSSLPEILQCPESLFDPRDLGEATRLLERALCDSAFRSHLRQCGRRAREIHQWDYVASKAIATLEVLAREVTIPGASVDDYVNRGFPRAALGRTIPLACFDD